MIAKTPEPPYYAVIFTSTMTQNSSGYQNMVERMMALASQQKGFLGEESARNELGITVSYWQDLESIKSWKANTEHRIAQKVGQDKWYLNYKVRIAKIERDYSLE